MAKIPSLKIPISVSVKIDKSAKQKHLDKKKQREWDLYFLGLAKLVATKSCDTSMKVGAVIVGPDNEIRSTGYNGFPRGVEPTSARLERPTKYSFTEHAERNAIYNASRSGIATKDCTMYVTCLPLDKGGNVSCNDCARAIIQAGIKRVVEYDTPNVSDEQAKGTWRETLKYSYQMLREGGVQLSLIYE